MSGSCSRAPASRFRRQGRVQRGRQRVKAFAHGCGIQRSGEVLFDLGGEVGSVLCILQQDWLGSGGEHPAPHGRSDHPFQRACVGIPQEQPPAGVRATHASGPHSQLWLSQAVSPLHRPRMMREVKLSMSSCRTACAYGAAALRSASGQPVR